VLVDEGGGGRPIAITANGHARAAVDPPRPFGAEPPGPDPRGDDADPRAAVVSTRTSMRCHELMPFEAWTALGAKLGMYANASVWWLGDWLAFGQGKYGRRYKDALAVTGLDYQTLRNYAVVARRFEPSRRRGDLTFQHHAEVCALADDEQGRWLDLAAEQRWSRNELRRRIREAARRLPAPPDVRLVVRADAERERRWREAAARSDCDLEHWIVGALDRAAGA